MPATYLALGALGLARCLFGCLAAARFGRTIQAIRENGTPMEALGYPAVRGLSRRLAAVDALKDVSFAVDAGEVHALIGPNGAGKATFIHQVSGALQPDAGSAHFAGRDITRLAMQLRVAVGPALITMPRLLVFDEATEGLVPLVREEI